MRLIRNCKRFLLVPALAIFFAGCGDENIENFIKDHAKAISNVDVNSEDDTDLIPIGNAIGDARIVMLGEQDHGDATSFLAKTRIIKFLHEKKGFNVLAFESDFFALTEGWDHLSKNKKSITDFIQGNIFNIWSWCDACSYLFNQYIPNSFATKNPLVLTGFDSQLVLSFSQSHLSRLLDSVLIANLIPITKTQRYSDFINKDLKQLLAQYQARNESQDFYFGTESILQEIKTEWSANTGASDTYWTFIIDNLLDLTKQLASKNVIESGNYRDKRMALNLAWLVNNKFRNQKLIVWAHNVHIMKNTENFSDSRYRSTSMSSYYFHLPNTVDKAYVMGFTSAKGIAGRIGTPQYKIQQGETKSLDHILLKLNYPFAFLDFTDFNTRYPNANTSFLMKASGHSYSRELWNRAFDGVFYIRDMHPCKIDSTFY